MASENTDKPQTVPAENSRPTQAVQVVWTTEVMKTVRLGLICLTIIAIAIVVAYVVIRIYTYDPWIELIVFLVGPPGILTAVLAWLLRRLRRRLDSVQSRMPAAAPPTAPAEREKNP